MMMSDRGIAALLLHEGIVPAPYRDSVGVWTYGVGHTAAAGHPDPAKMPRAMPADLTAALRYVMQVLREDLPKYEREVEAALRVRVPQHQFDALVSFHFNTGGIARAQLTKHLNAGRIGAAADGFLGWLKPAEIEPRRRAEMALFRSGIYPDGDIPVWPTDGRGRVIWRPVRLLSQAEAVAMLRPVPPDVELVAPLPDGGWLGRLIASLFRRTR